jgi:hypothetical protein
MRGLILSLTFALCLLLMVTATGAVQIERISNVDVYKINKIVLSSTDGHFNDSTFNKSNGEMNIVIEKSNLGKKITYPVRDSSDRFILRYFAEINATNVTIEKTSSFNLPKPIIEIRNWNGETVEFDRISDWGREWSEPVYG